MDRLQCMVRVMQNDPHPSGQHEIDQPPPLRDLASRRLGREFRSSSGLLCPFEVGFIFPQRQHQDRDFPRGCNCGLGKPAPPSKPYRPALQRREPLHSMDQSTCGLDQCTTHGLVTAFRDAARPAHLAGLISSWRETEERPNIARPAKPRRIIDQRDKAQRNDRANPGDCHQSSGYRVALRLVLDRPIQIRSGLAQGGMGRDEPVRDGVQH